MNKILTNTVAQSNLKQKYKNKLRTIWKKVKTPQVQVNFSGSYNVFYLVFLDFNWYYCIDTIASCSALVAIAFLCTGCILFFPIIQLSVPVTGYILPVCIMKMLLLVSVWPCTFNLLLICVNLRHTVSIGNRFPWLYINCFQSPWFQYIIIESSIFPWWLSKGGKGACFKRKGGCQEGRWLKKEGAFTPFRTMNIFKE